MHVTLHLTDRCNMRCRYCYSHHGTSTMSAETARKACDMAISTSGGKPVGVIFFGGEPLLCRDLIYETVEYAESRSKTSGVPVYFKITTNGTLLDSEFVGYACAHRMFIAFSHDGVREAHDACRVFADGSGSYDILEEKMGMLLSRMPSSPALMTVTPETARYFADGVKYLFSCGFRYIITSPDYSGAWDDASMMELKRQYRRLAEFYLERTLAEDKFYLSPFEVKMSSHIRGTAYRHERCELGRRQLSVAPDGGLYPCVQFVGHDEYRIGDAESGIDESRRQMLYERSEEIKPECKDCSAVNRCNSHCGCLNLQTTGSIDSVSPVLCEHERMLIPIADHLAETLYRRRSAMFIQKHYNDMFPVISLIEDRKTILKQ
nr:SPASM domain-containing protein [Clostridia bacterium]